MTYDGVEGRPIVCGSRHLADSLLEGAQSRLLQEGLLVAKTYSYPIPHGLNDKRVCCTFRVFHSSLGTDGSQNTESD